MVRRMLLTVAVLSLMTAPVLADAPASKVPEHWNLRNSPLAKMVSGTVGRLLVLHSEMNLTQDQKGQIIKLLLSHRSEIASTVKSVHVERTALRDLVLAEKTDEAAIRAQAEKLGKAIGEASVKAAKLRKDLGAILTTEQKILIRRFIVENDNAVGKFLDKVIKGQ